MNKSSSVSQENGETKNQKWQKFRHVTLGQGKVTQDQEELNEKRGRDAALKPIGAFALKKINDTHEGAQDKPGR